MDNTERKMMRSQEEIFHQVISFSHVDDFLGIKKSDLIMYLDYKFAHPYLKLERTEEEWNNLRKEEGLDPIEEMKSYMPFAWDKANHCRGLSAARSLDHYWTWLWLIGEEEIPKTFANYQFYGKDQLIAVCVFLGLDHSQWDDGKRVNSEVHE